MTLSSHCFNNNMKEQFTALELDVVKQQIAMNCCFSLGREQIMETQPSYDLLWVKRVLAQSKEALAMTIRYGSMPFLGLRDVRDSIEAAQKDMTLTAQELRQIADQANATKAITKYRQMSEMKTPFLDELLDSFSDINACSQSVDACISINYDVLDKASPALAQIRRSLRQCEGDMSKEVQRFIAAHASLLMDTITTTRNDRICVLVKISEKNKIRGFIHGESASGQAAYIEPESLLQLNNRLQSYHSREKEVVNRILFELSQQVKAYAHAFLANLETLAILDACFAKANWAYKCNGCIAQIVEDDTSLYLKQARHPLIHEQSVVANTYEIKKPYQSLLITGSNTGGKTVTLKTIGLFVAMNQCGFPLNAEEAILPFFSSIFVDIGDDQSIQESLSTFSAHISKLAYIIDHVDAHSLVLLDELGSGTDPKEGESLAVAVLDELCDSHAMIIATTHFSALKTYAKKRSDMLVSSVEFDVETMRPTYRYIEGISGQSNALAIAARYQLKQRVLDKAQQLRDEKRSNEDDLIDKLEASILENQQKKDKIEATLQDVALLQETLLKQKEDFEKSKEASLEKVKEEYKIELEATKEKAEAMIRELQSFDEDVKGHVLAQMKHDVQNLEIDEAPIEEVEETFVVGDYVRMKKLNYYGEVLSVNKDKVCVFANGMKMNTRSSELTHATKQVDKKKSKGYQKVMQSTSFSMECNVIGMRVLEATAVIDKYLDNAMIAKVYQVRLIHGNGTGALRTGVHTYLKRNPYVEEYHMGGLGEGGLGATVVTLKQKGKK